MSFKVSKTFFEGYSLSADEFRKTLEHFPDLLEVMKLVATQRLKKLGLEKLVLMGAEDLEVKREAEKDVQRQRLELLGELFAQSERGSFKVLGGGGGGKASEAAAAAAGANCRA